jgi:hypothetical protein
VHQTPPSTASPKSGPLAFAPKRYWFGGSPPRLGEEAKRWVERDDALSEKVASLAKVIIGMQEQLNVKIEECVEQLKKLWSWCHRRDARAPISGRAYSIVWTPTR